MANISAKDVAQRQPAKLAAMEAHFHTEKNAPLIIGGIPDTANKTVNYALRIPGLLSFMAHGDMDAEVTGLDQIPKDEQPPIAVTHYAFQVMVGLGMLMLGLAILYFIALWKKKNWLQQKWLLNLFVITTPLGFIALEAGWTVTEVGRQPWIIQGIMRTADALTPMPGIRYSFYLFTLVYLSLFAIVTFLLYRQITMVGTLYDSETNPPKQS